MIYPIFFDDFTSQLIKLAMSSHEFLSLFLYEGKFVKKHK
jgi:hypothetical protein